jgi:hypothetical protein
MLRRKLVCLDNFKKQFVKGCLSFALKKALFAVLFERFDFH